MASAFGDVDAADARVRVRAAQRVAPEHPRRLQVARAGELAGGLRLCVRAQNGLADAAELERLDVTSGLALDAHIGTTVTLAVCLDRMSGWWVGVPQEARRKRSCRSRPVYRLEDPPVARAAAEVARQRLPDLVVARRRCPLEQVGCGDHQTRCAEAALHRASLDEGPCTGWSSPSSPASPSTVTTSWPSAWPRARGTRSRARRRAAPSRSRTRPARRRSSSRAGRAARATRRAGSHRARRPFAARRR